MTLFWQRGRHGMRPRTCGGLEANRKAGLPQGGALLTSPVNSAGMSVSIDNLGENVTTPAEASQAAALYRELLAQISARGLNANVSVKLTHMGLDVNQQLAYDNVTALVSQAGSMQPTRSWPRQ